MNSLIVFSHKLTAVVLLLVTSIVVAQSHYKESFNVGEDVLVSVDVSHTDVVFETWNKDKIEVEAYVEGKNLSEKEKKEIFDSWSFDVLGNSKKVVITSNTGSLWNGFESIGSLKALEHLGDMPVLENLSDLNLNIVIPDVPDFKKFPNWPFSNERPSIKSGDGYSNYNFNNNGAHQFDSRKYEKDKEAYVAKLNKKYGTNVKVSEVDAWLNKIDVWADGFEDVMEDWGKDFGKKFEEKFGPEFEKKMEKWGEEFGEKMEVWGEKFGEEMEKYGERLGEDIEKWAEQFDTHGNGNYSKTITTDKHGNKSIIVKGSKNKNKNKVHSKAKKKIIIRMPKGTKTDINVRYGEVKMADAYNVKATLKYSSFIANSIDGGNSLINVSYAPVSVNNWLDGALKVKYVDDCKLNLIKNINLQANSSNVNINTIDKNAYLSGSFGNLFINNVANNFETIDIVLENTDATIKIPDTAFSFYFNGKKSTFAAPASLNLKKTVNGDRILQKGFFKSENTNKSFTINATYSNVAIHCEF